MKRRLLALDLGSKCGAAYKTETGHTCETWNFSPKRAHSPGMRWLHFIKRLEEFHAMAPIGLVVYEAVNFSTTTHAGHIYGGFLAHLQAFCDQRDIKYYGVEVATLKKWATGKGNAKKEVMVEAAIYRGWAPEDDNAADAALLYDYARLEILPGLRG